jgi:hypothetical protein
MANFFEGFAQGFAGAREARARREESALDRMQRQEELEFQRSIQERQLGIQQKQHDLELKKHYVVLSEKFLTIMGAAGEHPAARGFVMDRLARDLGVDTKSETYTGLRKLMLSLPAEQRQAMVDGFTALNPQLPPGQVATIVGGLLAGKVDPLEIGKMLTSAAQQQQRSATPLIGAGGAVSQPSAAPTAPGQPPRFLGTLLQPDRLETGLTVARPRVGQPAGAPAPSAFDENDPASIRREALRRRNLATQAAQSGDMDFATRLEGEVDDLLRLADDVQRNRTEEGKLTVQRQEATTKQRQQEVQRQTQARIVVDDIDRAVGIIEQGEPFLQGAPVTGIGSILKLIPGSAARDLQATLDTIGANISFDKLQEMRASSQTGAALGSVSDFENRLLASVRGSLDQAQGGPQLVENLRRIQTLYQDIISGGAIAQLGQLVEDGVLEEHEAQARTEKILGIGGDNGGEIPQIKGDADYDKLPSGTEFIAPDGTRRRKP